MPYRSFLWTCCLLCAVLVEADSAAAQPPTDASHPALTACISARTIAAALRVPLDSTAPFHLRLRGTEITGMGRLIAEVTAVPAPSVGYGTLAVTMQGLSSARSYSDGSLIKVNSINRSQVMVQQSLYLTGHGLRQSELTVSTPTTCQILEYGGSLPLHPPDWRVHLLQDPANRQATEATEIILRKQYSEQSQPQLQQLEQQLQSLFLRPLHKAGILPHDIRFSSTPHALALHIFQHHVPLTAPPALQPADVHVVLRETLLNALLQAEWGGRTVSDADLEKGADGLLTMFNIKPTTGAAAQPWTMTFAQRDPISLYFRDNRIILVLRAAAFTSGNETYPGMNIKTHWRVAAHAHDVRLVRGEVEVFPPGHESEQPRLQPARMIALRTVLWRRFSNVLPREIQPNLPLQTAVAPGPQSTSAPPSARLQAARLSAQDGWLLAEWHLVQH